MDDLLSFSQGFSSYRLDGVSFGYPNVSGTTRVCRLLIRYLSIQLCILIIFSYTYSSSYSVHKNTKIKSIKSKYFAEYSEFLYKNMLKYNIRYLIKKKNIYIHTLSSFFSYLILSNTKILYFLVFDFTLILSLYVDSRGKYYNISRLLSLPQSCLMTSEVKNCIPKFLAKYAILKNTSIKMTLRIDLAHF